MSKKLDKQCKKLEKECETVGIELSAIIDDNFLFQIDNEFFQSFGFKIDSKNDYKEGFLQAYLPIKNIMKKLLRNERSCIVFGESSVGKSSLINAILKMEYLKTDFGATSNCFVAIKPTNEILSYIEINNEKRPLEDLFQLNDYTNEMKFQDGSHIDAFINKGMSQFLQEDFVLIDTPGINHDNVMDISVENYAVDADVVILIINSTSTINNTIKTFINRFKNQVSKLNFFIVFNYWDGPGSRQKRETTKLRFLNEAKNLLCGVLSYNDIEAEERIFFLCAYEQIMLNDNDPDVSKITYWEERRDSFTKFEETFKTNMIENSLHRKRRYLNELHSQVEKCLTEYEKTIKFIKNEIERIKNKLGKINLDSEIKSCTTKVFKETSSNFINEARKLISFKQSRIKNEKEELEKEIFVLLQQIIHRSIEKFKEDIRNLLKGQFEPNDELYEILMKIVGHIYFPLYVDKYQIEGSFMENILKIRKKIKISTIVASSLCVLFGPIIFGIPFVIAAFVPGVTIATAAITATVSSVAVTSSAAGITAKLIKFMESPFEFVWEKDAAPIRVFVYSLRDELTTSYSKFIEAIEQNFENLVKTMDETQTLQNKFTNMADKVRHCSK